MKAYTKQLLVAVFTVCFSTCADADLTSHIDRIVNSVSQKTVEFSIHVRKADTGETIYSHNAHKALVPASNMKIITTAAALEYLGPSYEYKTRVGLCGETLVVTASGDPLLGCKLGDAEFLRGPGWILNDITEKLKRKGIRAIKDIVVDTSVFDDQRVHPNWPKDQLNRSYACEVSGLNFNGNCVNVSAKNTAGRVIVSVEPRTDFVRLVNKVRPVKQGSSPIGSYRTSKPNKIIVYGKCKKHAGPFAVAIERPAAFFAFLLAENLARAGINTQGHFLEKTRDKRCDVDVFAQYTTPIADCLVCCNKYSIQLAAESLLKTISANANADKKAGTWQAAREIVSQYLLNLGLQKEEFYIDDGSGLSKHNKLSANAITTVLSHAYNGKNWPLYRDSLAVGGVDGTIKKYFTQKKYEGKILGKTGYVHGVKSFSGICTTSTGDYIFSIIANNTNNKTRKAINDIAKAIIDNAEK